MARIANVYITAVFLLFVAFCCGNQANYTTPMKRKVLEEERAVCQQPIVRKYNARRIEFTRHYIRPILKISENTSIEHDINFSEPLKVCRNCVIYSIKGHVMGIHETIVQDDPFHPDVKCKVSLAEIEEIVSNFENIINGALMKHSLLASTNDECQEALQSISELSGELADLLQQMKKAQGVSPEEYSQMKNSYEEKINRLKQQMDFIKRQADQAAREEVDKAQRAMDEVQKNYIDAMDQLEKEIAKNQEQLIELTGLYIREGQIEQAKAKYDELVDRARMPDIVKGAYDVSKIDQILLFSDTLSTVDEKLLLSISLVDNMKSDMYSPMVLVVDGYVTAIISNGDQVIADKLQDTREKLQSGVLKVMNSFGSQIITNSDQTALEFAQDRPGILDNYITDLVKAAYGFALSRNLADDAALKIIDFGEMIYSDDVRLSTWDTALFFQMKKADKMVLPVILRIGYRDFKIHDKVSALWWALPKELRHVLSGHSVSMPFGLGENYDSERIYVVTQGFPATGSWRFVTDDGRTFHIMSDSGNYQLYAANDHFTYSSSERRVFAWKHPGARDSQGNWEIRDVNWKNNEYQFFNREFSEYLNVGHSKPPDFGQLIPDLFPLKYLCTWRKDGKGPAPTWSIGWIFDGL